MSAERTDRRDGAEHNAQRVAARAAVAAPETIVEESREVEVVFSTGALGRNYVPGVGLIWEELDMSSRAIRLGPMNQGAAPVLDSHSRWSASDVLGRVLSARIEGGKAIARLRFASTDDVASVWGKVKDGTLRTVSVGYVVHRYETRKDGDRMIYRAVDWEPFEISVVPIPLDAGATFREAAAVAAPVVTTEPPTESSRMEHQSMTTRPDTPAEGGAPATTATPPAGTPPVDPAAAAERAIAAERARMAGVEEALRAAAAVVPEANLSELRTRAMREGLTVEAVRAAALDAAVEASRSGGHVNGAHTAEPQPRRPGSAPAVAIGAAISHALALRARPEIETKLAAMAATDEEKAAVARSRDYRGWRFSDMLREYLEACGERNLPRDPAAFAVRAMHSTSDFPLLLANALNKSLMADYALAVPTYRSIFARRSFNDFKPHSFLRVGDFPTLLPLGEGGEIKSGTISESGETVSLATFARRVRVSRPMIVNDDLSAFNDFASMIGRRVVDFENATAWALVNLNSGAGPNLSDTGAVFQNAAGRGNNRAASATAIDVDSVSLARVALRNMQSADGLRLNLAGRFLVTGSATETAADRLLADTTPNQASQVNPFSGRMEKVTDANVPGNRWYVFADPAVAPVYIWGYLAGAEGPQTATGPMQGYDGFEVSVLLDFGVGAIDWRGGYFNG